MILMTNELLEEANSLFSKGNYKLALTVFEKTLKHYPNNAEAWFGKGRTLYELKKRISALTAFQNAAKINPRYRYYLYYEKGKAFALKKKYARAYELFDLALEIKPDFHEIYLNKGAIEIARENYDLAEEFFDKAIEIYPEFEEAKFYKDRVKEIKSIGVIAEDFKIDFNNLFDENDTDLDDIDIGESDNRSNKDKEKIIDKIKSEEWLTKGLTQKMLGNNVEALKSFEQAINKDNSNHKAWLSKALVLNIQNRKEEALEAVNISLQFNPENIEAKDLLKRLQ